MVWLFALSIFIFFEGNASAYIDPGAGSYAVQIVIAAVVAGLFFIKSFFQKMTLFIKKFFSVNGK